MYVDRCGKLESGNAMVRQERSATYASAQLGSARVAQGCGRCTEEICQVMSVRLAVGDAVCWFGDDSCEVARKCI